MIVSRLCSRLYGKSKTDDDDVILFCELDDFKWKSCSLKHVSSDLVMSSTIVTSGHFNSTVRSFEEGWMNFISIFGVPILVNLNN